MAELINAAANHWKHLFPFPTWAHCRGWNQQDKDIAVVVGQLPQRIGLIHIQPFPKVLKSPRGISSAPETDHGPHGDRSGELASRLRAVEDELPEILELGLREWLSTPPGYAGLGDVLETLARLPSPEEVLGLSPATHLQDRIEELLAKNRAGPIFSLIRSTWLVETSNPESSAKASFPLAKEVNCVPA